MEVVVFRFRFLKTVKAGLVTVSVEVFGGRVMEPRPVELWWVLVLLS